MEDLTELRAEGEKNMFVNVLVNNVDERAKQVHSEVYRESTNALSVNIKRGADESSYSIS